MNIILILSQSSSYTYQLLYTGIVLDFCDWTVKKQFKRHYNASHPLVIDSFFRSLDTENYRYIPNLNPEPIYDPIPYPRDYKYTIHQNPHPQPRYVKPSTLTPEELVYLMPYYPNDGVLLIDIDKFNRWKILERANEIALRNAKGEFVVNLGESTENENERTLSSKLCCGQRSCDRRYCKPVRL
jgi:hypothetical protein